MPLLLLAFLFLVSPAFAQDAELVDIKTVDSQMWVDLKYATPDNFMKEVLYDDDRCFLRADAALRLLRAQNYLKKQGYQLVVLDCYRPLAVQKKMFKRFPQPGFVADPNKGSNHNRGAAVDVRLANYRGHVLEMTSEYDEFSERSHEDYDGGTAHQYINRSILREGMKAGGFESISTEWWHFNAPGAKSYDVLDVPIESLP